MHPFKRNEIIILLGAGASVEANIPHSAKMIQKVEKHINCKDGGWSQFKNLYNYIRSSIYYSEGIWGKFDDDVNYNIERLVNTLDELKQKDHHTLFPFVGPWNPKLVEVAGDDFKLLGELRNAIVKKLRDEWIALERFEDANYFRGLTSFQREYQHPLRVFTLNYDLCIERACTDAEIERGFDENRKWDWRQFDDNPNDPKDMFLYKLHGSTDWKYDDNGILTYVDNPSRIDEAAIIFGTTYKLQYVDPFLFFAYQFRRWVLEARIIISIGYGFGDEHINGMLRQALNGNKQTLLLSVSPLSNVENEDEAKAKKGQEIAQSLKLRNSEQIVCYRSGAQAFLTDHLKIDLLASLLPPEENLFPIVSRD